MKAHIHEYRNHGRPDHYLALHCTAEQDGLGVTRVLTDHSKVPTGNYQVSHLASGYSLTGRGFFKASQARAALRRLAALTDWTRDKDAIEPELYKLSESVNSILSEVRT